MFKAISIDRLMAGDKIEGFAAPICSMILEDHDWTITFDDGATTVIREGDTVFAEKWDERL